MADDPYERFKTEQFILRDELAIDRTILANERTGLAYSRTALALIITGIALLHFFERGWLRYIGLLFIPLGVATGVIGYFRFTRMKRSIQKARERHS